jgi:hypothetical protein
MLSPFVAFGDWDIDRRVLTAGCIGTKRVEEKKEEEKTDVEMEMEGIEVRATYPDFNVSNLLEHSRMDEEKEKLKEEEEREGGVGPVGEERLGGRALEAVRKKMKKERREAHRRLHEEKEKKRREGKDRRNDGALKRMIENL